MNLDSGRVWLSDLWAWAEPAWPIHLGLVVLIVAIRLLRRPLGHWQPLAVVAIVALAGSAWEYFDGLMHGASPRLVIEWKTVVATIFWPAILSGLARFTRLI